MYIKKLCDFFKSNVLAVIIFLPAPSANVYILCTVLVNSTVLEYGDVHIKIRL